MMKRLDILMLLIMCTIWGCEETQEVNLNSADDSLLVVEALITNENKRHEVRLSQTFNNLTATPEAVNNAIVVLNDGTDNQLLKLDIERPGIYLSDSMRALIGKKYTLFILHDDREYFAITAANFGTPLEPLIIEEKESGMFEYIYQESSQPSMMEIEINWEDLNESGAIVKQDIHAFYYTLNVIDVNQIFAPDKEKIIFPVGAQLLRRKYSLTQNHQEFLRSFLSEVDWRGGPFDVAPGNVKTNLSEGAVGYFAVSMVQTDINIVN